ncbi:hypothetical protein BC830DRAFT_1094357 [Chytriomyces sp. MP71]|nr:hypothetical protein BC830DRAFT_1094357 [Chytriomyces sp. MP71]
MRHPVLAAISKQAMSSSISASKASSQGSTTSTSTQGGSAWRTIASVFPASTNIPGGLSADQTPQFVTLTIDDAIQPRTFDAFYPVIQQNFTNPNGCPLPVTYFLSNNWADYAYATRLYNYGNEIAVHTVDHIDLASNPVNATSQINSSYVATHMIAGIPQPSLIGFRHPFLSYSKATFDAIYSLKTRIRYDSSVTVNPVKNPYWPHTLDNGVPYGFLNCASCPPGSSFIYPGMSYFTVPRRDESLSV